MPLLDHFHPPLHPQRPWESFHSAWAGEVMGRLNALLPPRYFAVMQTHFSRDIEADIAELDTGPGAAEEANGTPGGTAVATWAPPAATLVLSAIYPDDIEVQVMDTRDGAVLVAVVELVSPRNKDRPEARRAFA